MLVKYRSVFHFLNLRVSLLTLLKFGGGHRSAFPGKVVDILLRGSGYLEIGYM